MEQQNYPFHKCNGTRAVPIGNLEMVSMYFLHYIPQEAFLDEGILLFIETSKLTTFNKEWVKKGYNKIKKLTGEN